MLGRALSLGQIPARRHCTLEAARAPREAVRAGFVGGRCILHPASTTAHHCCAGLPLLRQVALRCAHLECERLASAAQLIVT